MLVNVLTFQERETWLAGYAVDVDALRKTMDLLHKDDRAVLHYFGLDKQALIQRIICQQQYFECMGQLPPVEVLRNKICMIEALSLDGLPSSADQENFYWFYLRFYCYLMKCFESDNRYSAVCEHADVQALLSGVMPYVISSVKRLSQKSLVHALNSRISERREIDLETFNQQLKSQVVGSILTAYPVLTRLLIEHIENTVAYLYKVIFHFAGDVDVLEREFSLPGRRIDSVTLGLGDPHAAGETVCSIQVGNQALIYKPKSNGEALFYGSLLKLLHEKTQEECFSAHTPSMVSLDGRCWVEKIENLACETEADVALFYRRMGAQVAVIHALNGIDFHYENIIACANSPVMIDLECLFTAAMIDLKVKLPHSGALFKTLKQNSQSIFSSGFVPFSPDADNDFSGLTHQRQFISSKKQLVFEQGFYRLKQVKSHRALVLNSRPVFKGEPQTLQSYKGELFQGFQTAYDEVMNHQDAVLELITQYSSELNTRVLIKNTKRYDDFIELMLHPRFMQCMLQRELLLATLWSESNETLAGHDIPRHEIVDLARANVPYFAIPINSNQLVNAQGVAVAVLDIESPLESCIRKIRGLSPGDKAYQISILDACLFPVANEALPLNRRHGAKGGPSLGTQQFFEGAQKIAAVIDRMCISGEDGDVGWGGLNTHPKSRRKYISPMGNGLYDGMGGLAVFYLSLFKVSGLQEYLDRTDEIVCSMDRSHGHFDSDMTLSAYFGLASYIYVLVNYQQVTGREIYRTAIDELLLKLGTFPRKGDEFDFLNGWCGAATLLVNLYRLEARESLLPLIERFSEAIQAELFCEEGVFFHSSTRAPLLTGFSHGISGVLYALGKVYDITRDSALAVLIAKLLRGENHHTAQGFWLDLRDPSNPGCMTKWCHGDAGILLSRLFLRNALGDTLGAEIKVLIERDIATCEHNIWCHGLGAGYSLCHGDFGNLICLLDLYRSIGSSKGIERVERALGEAAHNFFKEDFLDQNSVPDLGLMLGISGVGHGLLYAIDATLPNVLSLEFSRPCTTHAAHLAPDVGVKR